jgi:Family of unknown function (DUF6101)
LRRQTMPGGTISAGSSPVGRLGPFALPVRFTAHDAVADGQVRNIEIDCHRIRLRRTLRGMVISVNVPANAFRGVALRLVPGDDGQDEAVAISLEHRDPALSVQLFAAPDNFDIIAEWRSWGRVLGLPLLFADRGGALSEPFPMLGALRVGAVGHRRRRRNAIKRRRGSLPLRRRVGVPSPMPIVRREREIIARN